MTYYTNCCVKACSNIFRPDSDTRFFEFPFHKHKLLNEWLKAIGFDDYSTVSQNTLICSEHFTDDDYVLENGSYELSSSAIPSRFESINESIASSNVIGPTFVFNDNWSNSPLLNNFNNEGINRDVQCNKSHSISSKNNYKINGCVKTVYSSNNASKINNDSRIAINNTMASHSNFSNKFDEDIFIVEQDQDDEVENPLVINSPSVYVPRSHNMQTVKTMVSSKPKTKVRPMWELNQKTKVKHKIPNSFTKKLKLLGQKNKRLCSKVRDLASRKQDFLDLQVKYVQLKLAVLETENKLLLDGVDTSNYPAFQQILSEDKEICPKPNNIEYDFLLECKLKELENPNMHIDNNPRKISPECSTQIPSSAESETLIILQ